MNQFIFFFSLLIIALASIGYDIYRRQFCKNCGSRMDHLYDVEEDAEVYQCPKCGRSYIKR